VNMNNESRIIRGIAASDGLATGEAFVANSLEEARERPHIDILVVTYVTPDWIDILARCRSVVTDQGGRLSHPANLCRELGRPAVVGTEIATKRIQSGDLVLVDGSRGLVEVLRSASSR